MAAQQKGKLLRFGERLAHQSQKAGEAFKPHATTPQVATDYPDLGEVVGSEWIEVDLIDDNPYQYREEYPNAEQGEMVEDFNANGQLQEGAVRNHPTRAGRYQLIWAHRRKYSVKSGYLKPGAKGAPPTRIYGNAGSQMPHPEQYIGKLRVRIYRNVSDLQMRKWAHSENTSRVDPKAMELAKFYRDTLLDLTNEGRRNGTIGRDIKGEWKSATQTDLAAFLGKNLTHVNRYLRLLDLPSDMQKAIADGAMNARHGRALLDLAPWEEHQRALFKDIRKAKLSGEAAEGEANRRKNFLLDKAPNAAAQEAARQEAQLQRSEARFDPEAELQAQRRRAELAEVLRTPEEAAALQLGQGLESATHVSDEQAQEAAQQLLARLGQTSEPPVAPSLPLCIPIARAVPRGDAGIRETTGEALIPRTEEELADANAQMATAIKMAGQIAEKGFEGVDESFEPSNLVVTSPAPPAVSGTSGVAQVPGLTDLTKGNMIAAVKNLNWAHQGFDILECSEDDLQFMKEHLSQAAKFILLLSQTLTRHEKEHQLHKQQTGKL